VIEVMGHDSGFLALMSAVATGAERAYLPEEGISLASLSDDVEALRAGFARGKRRGVVLRAERADELYTTAFVASLLSHESGGVFDVRTAILGAVQQGGAPSPFDRIQATRLASAAVERLIAESSADRPASAMVGLRQGKVAFTPLAEFPALTEPDAQRPQGPAWWLPLRPLLELMALPQR
jgi:6-phosphofructokinase 1